MIYRESVAKAAGRSTVENASRRGGKTSERFDGQGRGRAELQPCTADTDVMGIAGRTWSAGHEAGAYQISTALTLFLAMTHWK
jgi:hypothetical protein